MNNTTYIGLGYIGLPTAILTAKSGIKTFGYDVDTVKIDKISKCDILTKEPGLKKELENVINSGLLHVSKNIKKSSTYIIVVPTPLSENNQPDTSIVIEAIHSIIPFLKGEDLVIIESTCPVQTTEKMKNLIELERPELKGSIYMAYCPERVLPGNILHELVYNDRIIGGINHESSLKAKEFYENFVKGEIHITNSRTAEMCKLTENSARDAQIAFANELSMICEEAKIDVWELIYLANKHPRVNILNPGIGVGGHCIAVDPWFLVADFPEEAKLIKYVRETNNYKTIWCIEKVSKEVNDFFKKHHRNPTIACMGLAYKPNVDDLRESPAVYIYRNLIEKKYNIFAVEPNIKTHHNFNLTSIENAIEKADIVVWLVAHTEFKDLNVQESIIQIDFCGLTRQFHK